MKANLGAIHEFFVGFARSEPGILSRCKAFHLFRPGKLILGRYQLPELVADSMREFDNPHPLIKGTAVAADPEVIEQLEHLFELIGEVGLPRRLCMLARPPYFPRAVAAADAFPPRRKFTPDVCQVLSDSLPQPRPPAPHAGQVL